MDDKKNNYNIFNPYKKKSCTNNINDGHSTTLREGR